MARNHQARTLGSSLTMKVLFWSLRFFEAMYICMLSYARERDDVTHAEWEI